MKENLFDFTNKAVLITGGSTGIGRATALAFAQHGANILIGDLNESAAQETVELIRRKADKHCSSRRTSAMRLM